MSNLVLVIIFPLLWPFLAKVFWKHELDWRELTANVLLATLLAGGTYAVGIYSQVSDTEILNGEVTGKARREVSCSHSYSCNCKPVCTGSGTSRSCTTSCDTCYEHSHDVDWIVLTSLGEIEIDRVDRQGVREPSAFRERVAGDPVAKTHTFMNYVRASNSSLFHKESDPSKVFQSLPNYPSDIRNYHYVDRVLTDGVAVPELNVWNRNLALLLKELGPKKQANVIVVFTKNPDPSYSDALQNHWFGGKKNDVVLVVGTPEYPKIEWVNVFSWSSAEIFNTQLRDSVADLGTVDRDQIFRLIHQHTLSSFKRKSMKEYEYLIPEIEPPIWVTATATVLGIVGSVLLSLIFAEKINFRRRNFRYYR